MSIYGEDYVLLINTRRLISSIPLNYEFESRMMKFISSIQNLKRTKGFAV